MQAASDNAHETSSSDCVTRTLITAASLLMAVLFSFCVAVYMTFGLKHWNIILKNQNYLFPIFGLEFLKTWPLTTKYVKVFMRDIKRKYEIIFIQWFSIVALTLLEFMDVLVTPIFSTSQNSN